MADLPKPGSETKRERVLSDAELMAASERGRPIGWPYGPIVHLLILTGARREEMGGLRWAEIEGEQIRLSHDRTKNGEPRTSPGRLRRRGVVEGQHVNRTPTSSSPPPARRQFPDGRRESHAETSIVAVAPSRSPPHRCHRYFKS